MSHMTVDLVRSSPNLDAILQHMEEFATQVWPQV